MFNSEADFTSQNSIRWISQLGILRRNQPQIKTSMMNSNLTERRSNTIEMPMGKDQFSAYDYSKCRPVQSPLRAHWQHHSPLSSITLSWYNLQAQGYRTCKHSFQPIYAIIQFHSSSISKTDKLPIITIVIVWTPTISYNEIFGTM